jgi:hypothetical protein
VKFGAFPAFLLPPCDWQRASSEKDDASDSTQPAIISGGGQIFASPVTSQQVVSGHWTAQLFKTQEVWPKKQRAEQNPRHMGEGHSSAEEAPEATY